MATAPTPGKARARNEAQTVIRIKMGDRTLEVQPSALSLNERFIIRQVTGSPFEAFFQAIGEDSIAVLWWVARRANGEPSLAFQKFMGEWEALESADDFDIDIVEDNEEDDTSPEGSGSGSSTPSLA